MKNIRKKAVSVQDISSFGQCSLTVALPCLSALGIETAVVPTAVLSTHCGFEGFNYHDLTNEIPKLIEQWKNLGLKFDALYAGYLGNTDLIKYVNLLYDTVRTPNSFKLVDPAMADNGMFYAGFDKNYAKKTADFCRTADIITPNITEALFLCEDYDNVKEYYTKDDIKYIVDKIQKNIGRIVIITGIPINENEIADVCLDMKSGFTDYYIQEKIEGTYYGTGDIFASVCTGLFLRGMTLPGVLRQASDFVTKCIEHTKNDKDHWYGVHFEECLPELWKMIE